MIITVIKNSMKEEIIPEPGDIIRFSSGSIALVVNWNKSSMKIKTLRSMYIDRGWLYRLLEKWGWSIPKYKDEDILITNEAYLIGQSLSEGKD